MRTRRAGPTDRAGGVLSTTFGVGVFLSLLAFSSHVLLNLWVITTVDDVAHLAATEVAISGADDSQLAGAELRAISRARTRLGEWGSKVTLQFETDPTGTNIVLHVTSDQLHLLPAFTNADPGPPSLDRRVVVRRELSHP